MPRLSSLHDSRFSVALFRAHILNAYSSICFPCTNQLIQQFHYNLMFCLPHFSFSPVNLTSTAIHLCTVCMLTAVDWHQDTTFLWWHLLPLVNRQIHVPLFPSLSLSQQIPSLLCLLDIHNQCLCSAWFTKVTTSLQPGVDGTGPQASPEF